MSTEQRILSRLKRGTLTHLQCWNWFKTYRLASYILRIKKKGYRVISERVTKNGVSFVKYKLN